MKKPKKFKHGFVVGKFAPLHKGHQYLIDTALSQCEHVFVLSYTSQRFFNCDSITRAGWFDRIYKEQIDNGELVVSVLDPKTDHVPDDIEAPAHVHREFCSDIIQWQYGYEINAVFASETYGLLLAGEIGENCEFVMVDEDRNAVKISGTKVREMAANNYRDIEDWVHPEVFTTYIPKILILGGESSGKTTLVKALANVLDSPAVYEYGRQYWEETNGKLTLASMTHIAQTQREHEYQAAKDAYELCKEYVICDTCSITTGVYSQTMFGIKHSSLKPFIWSDMYRYSHVFICANDIEFYQDGTRRDPEFRERVYNFYRKVFDAFGVKYTIVSGSVEERVKQVQTELNSVL